MTKYKTVTLMMRMFAFDVGKGTISFLFSSPLAFCLPHEIRFEFHKSEGGLCVGFLFILRNWHVGRVQLIIEIRMQMNSHILGYNYTKRRPLGLEKAWMALKVVRWE